MAPENTGTQSREASKAGEEHPFETQRGSQDAGMSVAFDLPKPIRGLSHDSSFKACSHCSVSGLPLYPPLTSHSRLRVTLIESFPEPESHVQARAEARKEAEENSRLLSSEEKQKRAQATFLKVRKALLSGSAMTSADSIQSPPKLLTEQKLGRLRAACRTIEERRRMAQAEREMEELR